VTGVFSGFEVAVVGAGPAGLMAVETLAAAGARVTIHDRMPSVGRKFLMAGRGGLNLTHSEPFDNFMERYGDARRALLPAIEHFPPAALRAWCEGLGQPTFIGSSGRVFPQAFKASPLLRAWLRRLDTMGVRLALRHRWVGWTPDGALLFDRPDGQVSVTADVTILALGGASWPRLGSDGAWVDTLAQRGVKISTLQPANCGFRVAWSSTFRDRFEGVPLKGVALSVASRTARGELVVTRDGLEGGGIYALSAVLRDEIGHDGGALLRIALRPDATTSDLVARLSMPRRKQSVSTFFRKAIGLSPIAVALLQESAIANGHHLSTMSADELAAMINAVPIRLIGTAPLERAISTAGGVALADVDERYMLKRLPGVFVAGEMLDWEAPTGGYLLQASFATGVAAGHGALAWLGERPPA
jgi:uncharacterized flavoprotein (TIGR03862 family)